MVRISRLTGRFLFILTPVNNSSGGFQFSISFIIAAVTKIKKHGRLSMSLFRYGLDYVQMAIQRLIGFGKKQTPEAFRNACSHFTYVENLTGYEELSQNKEEPTQVKKEIINTINKEPIQTKPQSNSNLPLDKIKQIFDNHDTEWVSVASLGSQWKLLQVDFDPRTYGFKKLGDLVKAYPKVFDVEERSTSTNEHKNLYVRLKK